MTKLLFLSELKLSLDGELPQEEVLKHLQYYKEYMDARLGSESEEQITAALGDPRLIAKTLAETYRMTHSANAHFVNEEGEPSYHTDTTGKHRTSYGSDSGQEMRWLKIYRWVFSLVGIILLLLVIVVLFFIGKIAFRLFIPLLLVGVVVMLVRKFSRR